MDCSEWEDRQASDRVMRDLARRVLPREQADWTRTDRRRRRRLIESQRDAALSG